MLGNGTPQEMSPAGTTQKPRQLVVELVSGLGLKAEVGAETYWLLYTYIYIIIVMYLSGKGEGKVRAIGKV